MKHSVYSIYAVHFSATKFRRFGMRVEKLKDYT